MEDLKYLDTFNVQGFEIPSYSDIERKLEEPGEKYWDVSEVLNPIETFIYILKYQPLPTEETSISTVIISFWGSFTDIVSAVPIFTVIWSKVISIPEYHDEFVKIESYSRARKWDGKPVKYSTYA